MKIKKYIKKQMKKLEKCITYDVLETLQRESRAHEFKDENSKYTVYDPEAVTYTTIASKKQDFSQFIYEYQNTTEDTTSADIYHEIMFLKSCSGKLIKSIVKCNDEDRRYNVTFSDGMIIDCDINCIRMI